MKKTISERIIEKEKTSSENITKPKEALKEAKGFLTKREKILLKQEEYEEEEEEEEKEEEEEEEDQEPDLVQYLGVS